jgi:MFS family permease
MEKTIEIPAVLQPSRRLGLNKLLARFFIAMVLANVAANMYSPLLALYLKSMNAGVLEVGLFFTLSQIVPLLLQILGGWMSDSLGRLRSIAMGSVAGVLSYFGLILAPTWQWVLLGEGLASVTRSLVGPSFGAFIAENSSENNRARMYSISDAIFTSVIIIGPPLGGWLADTYGFRVMLVAAGALYTVATIIRVGMARTAAKGTESTPKKLSLGGLRSNLGTMTGLLLAGGVLTWLLITDGVRDIAFTMSFTLMPLYLEGIGSLSFQQIGWLNSVFGVVMLLVSFPAGWLADKKSERLAIVIGFALDALALVIFLAAQDFWGYALSWGVFGLGVGLMSPAYQSLMSKAIPEKVRGTGFGLLHTSLGLFSLPAPAIGSALWQTYSPRLPFTITAVVSLIAIIPAWFKFRLPRQDAEAAGEPEKNEDNERDST